MATATETPPCVCGHSFKDHREPDYYEFNDDEEHPSPCMECDCDDYNLQSL